MSRTSARAATALIALALLTVACGEAGAPVGAPTGSSPASPSPTTSPTSTVEPPAPRPGQFILANSSKGARIELRDSSTGDLVRVLAGPEEGIAYAQVAASAAGGTVYFTHLRDEDCSTRVMAVPLAGGDPEEIAEGRDPAVSPDGRWLAYRGLGSGPACSTEPPLVVRDLTTGEERTWRSVPWDQAYGEPQVATPHSLAWAPDSRHLLFSVTIGDPAFAVFILDRTKGKDLLDATRATIPDARSSLFHPAFGGSATAVVGVHQQLHVGVKPDAVVRFDAADGTTDVLVKHVFQTDGFAVDPSGRHLIMSGTEDPEGARTDATMIWSEGDGEPTRIAKVRGDVAWVA